MATPQLIGLDWGTTALRAYRFDGSGQVVESRHRPSGIMQITEAGAARSAGFERALDQACGDWIAAGPGCAMLACGMVGSAQGWREAPYVEVPASLDGLGGALTAVETARGATLHIVPGLIARGRLPDVLRGEETQVAGVLEPGPGRPTAAWIGLPGTHAKWVQVQDRRVVGFHTFMTGEVFAALCAHTILGRTMRPAAQPDLDAFDRGVAVARSPEGRLGPLSTMFSARTLGLVGALAAEAQADYLSGLLIGHEVAALGELGEPGEPIVLVGEAALCERYRRALAASGHAPAAIAAGATERGLWRIAVAAGLVAGAASSPAM
ncbi:MAG TPA: 2-dehydro-3-deoxygalactonokinase [Kofleriaceae bacterium]|nr:2-dehydro-3-deoxygalactonokinase [Kofleriaceae bacterium]